MSDTKASIITPHTERITDPVTELDIHRLDLRFEQIRATRPGEPSRLLQSIATEGLRLPIHVADTGDALILIDGYLRLGAYRLLQRDKIPAYCRRQSLSEALCEWFYELSSLIYGCLRMLFMGVYECFYGCPRMLD